MHRFKRGMKIEERLSHLIGIIPHTRKTQLPQNGLGSLQSVLQVTASSIPTERFLLVRGQTEKNYRLSYDRPIVDIQGERLACGIY